MSFRVSALVAVVGVLALGSIAPAFGQPIVPQRPRSQPFGGIFSPPLQQQQIMNPAMGGRGIGPGFVGQGLFGQGLGNPLFGQGLGAGPLAYQSAFPGAYGVDPLLPQTGVVTTFGNYGHWYPNGVGPGVGGNYGHWYPNGIANGRGVTAGTVGGGGGGGLYGGLNSGGGFRGGFGAAAGATVGGAAVGNQMRR